MTDSVEAIGSNPQNKTSLVPPEIHIDFLHTGNKITQSSCNTIKSIFQTILSAGLAAQIKKCTQ